MEKGTFLHSSIVLIENHRVSYLSSPECTQIHDFTVQWALIRVQSCGTLYFASDGVYLGEPHPLVLLKINLF